MINISYTPNIKEYAKITLFYIEKHFMIKLILMLMNISCIILFFGYVIKIYSNSINVANNFSVLFAILWLLFRRNFNGIFVRRSLKKKNIDKFNPKIIINDKRLSWQYKNKNFQHLLWNKIKKIYLIKNGYVIPKVLNAPVHSTFIWIPKSAFASTDEHKNFIEIIKKNNIKIK